MTPPPRADEVFAAALALTDPRARSAYLDRACAGKAGLREEVESLLAAATRAGTFLESPLTDAAAVLRETCQPTETPLAERAGSRIGRYKLLEQIGEGGFGVVWMAEQEEPVRRRVALKIIKLGMDTREVVARFEAERQALALMDHPNIAKVLDGGATDTGRPYFVMDLVKGVPITTFCDQRTLTTRQRLELFLQVCHAVQHAHQKGIIHRDLKPSNILVTVQDDRPLPKVIDFGVAKATQARLTEKTLFTRLQQWIGTPAYMSPEQAGLGSLDVDTRSDVYSLGVVLYELLTGRTPFDTQKLLATGYEAVMRTIREDDPPKPSTRLSTLKAEELSTAAAQRGSEPAKLNRLVRGDLDWIVMRCLEKDRARRYGGADGLAGDLERHLRNEPVTAVAPGAVYWARKFVLRHRVGLGMAAALLALLVAGTVVSAWQAVRAIRAERAQAQLRQQAERARANETTLREKAEELGAVARRQTRQISHQLYASHMSLAFQAWEKGDVARVEELLDAHQPRAGEEDLRGFEWYYLSRLSHSAQLTLRGHGAQMRDVGFSPDGRLLATVGDDSVARVWEADTGRERSALRGHVGSLTCVAFAPDGKTVATGGVDQTVRLWDVETGIEKAVLREHQPSVSALAFGPDGTWLAAATGRLATGTNYGSPSGKFVDSSELAAEIKVWRLADHRAVHTLKGHTRSILSLAVSPDGQQLATGGADACVRLWEVATGEMEMNPARFEGPILAVAFSPDGRALAIGGGDPYDDKGILRLWDRVAQTNRLVLKGHAGPVFALAFAPEGRTLASAGLDQVVRLWDVTSGEERGSVKGHSASIWSLVYDPTGRRIASASWDQTVKVWDAGQPQAYDRLPGAGGYASCFSPDGKYLIETVPQLMVIEPGVAKPPFIVPDYATADATVAMSPDGKTLASAGMDCVVTLWEVGTWRRLASLSGHLSKVWQLAFTPDARVLASADAESIWLWDLEQRVARAVFYPRVGGRVGAISFTPDGETLIASEPPGMTHFLDTYTGEPKWSLVGEFVALSPDGRCVAVERPLLALVDLATGQTQWQASSHRANVWGVRFSPDGKTLATASWDGTAKLWNVATGQEMFTHKASGVVWSATFSPDGEWWAVGSGWARKSEAALFRAAKPGAARTTSGGVAPQILLEPNSPTVIAGRTATLGVLAIGDPPLHFQWYRGSEILAGQNRATLILSNTTLAEAGPYGVRTTNALGSAMSRSGILTVVHVREVPIAEVNFAGKPPPARYYASTYSQRPAPLSAQITEAAGAGIGGGSGLVLKGDRSGFKSAPEQDWSGFGAVIVAPANRADGINTTNLNAYRLDATIRVGGLVGPNAHGRVQWQFLTPRGPILSVNLFATYTTNLQAYSFVLGEGCIDLNSGGSWPEFVAGFDQIDRVQCCIWADHWLTEYRSDADNEVFIGALTFVRLVTESSSSPR